MDMRKKTGLKQKVKEQKATNASPIDLQPQDRCDTKSLVKLMMIGPSRSGEPCSNQQMIRDLVGSDPALNQAAWDTLRGIVGLLQTSEAGTDSAGQPVNAADVSSAVH